ncbi:hypothetical protein LTR66_005060, partial [Elasticomyces elasticus]
MTSLTTYTPLESLLLFQSLRTYGVEATVFGRISDDLKKVPLVYKDPTYDAGRLNPDALRELYLSLLKEEVKKDLQGAGDEEQNASLSPGSRKRKAASPTLPTVHEAAQHSHLIPRLVERLYAAWRDLVVRELREEERQYDRLTREVQGIEEGEWDERLRGQQADSDKNKDSPAQRSSIAPGPESSTSIAAEVSAQTASSAIEQASPVTQATGPPPQPSSTHYAQASIDAVINHDVDSFVDGTPPGHRKASSTMNLPPLSGSAHSSPRLDRPGPQTTTPRLPPSLPAPSGYRTSPSLHTSHYALQPTQPGPPPSPRVPYEAGSSHPPSAPRPILPPPPGMHTTLPPASSLLQSQNNRLSDRSPIGAQPPPYLSPNQRLPPLPLSLPKRPGSRELPLPPNLQPPQGYQQQYPGRQTGYSPSQHQPPPPQQPPPPYYQPNQGGYMLPPFQVTPQEPNRLHQQQLAQQAAATAPRYPSAPLQPRPSPASNRLPPIPNSQPFQSAGSQQPVPPPRLPRTALQIQIDQILDALAKPRPKARWKSNRTGTGGHEINRPSQADIEPLSPVKEVVPPTKSLSRQSRDLPKDARATPAHRDTAQEASAGESSVDKVSQKANRKPTRRARGTSAVSPVAASSPQRRDRSQSVTSQRDERTGTTKGRPIKPEPSTPANDNRDNEATPASTATEGAITRRRRGTLQSLAAHSSTRRKRMRDASPSEAPSDAEDTGVGPSLSTPSTTRPNTVLATRNFGRISAVILNDIQSHKHADRFARPVRERDAEGYSDIIKRPQDLKSMRAAITAGQRAIIAATAASSISLSATTATTTGGGGGGGGA